MSQKRVSAGVEIRGTVESLAKREGSRPRSALRIQTPPLQRCTHRTPGCAPLKRRRHSPARSTCAAASVLRSSPLGADMVGKSRNMSADMLIMPGLLALMPPTICCVRSQSVRDLVTEISGGATPHRCGVAQSSSSELATQAWPSQPHSRLVVPVHVGSHLAHSGSPTHPSLGRLSTVPRKYKGKENSQTVQYRTYSISLLSVWSYSFVSISERRTATASTVGGGRECWIENEHSMK